LAAIPDGCVEKHQAHEISAWRSDAFRLRGRSAAADCFVFPCRVRDGNDFLSIKLNRVFLFFWQNTQQQLRCSIARPGPGKMICKHKSMRRSAAAPFWSGGSARTKPHP
jgi:hypothetical protein